MITGEQLVTPKEEPRFFDPLEAEQERDWARFVDLIKESTDENAERAELLKSVWHDPEMPVAIRDRAVLTLFGYNVGDTGESPSGIFRFNPWAAFSVEFSQQEETELDTWYVKLLECSDARGEAFLSASHELMIAGRYFDNGAVSQALFEAVLHRIDLRSRGVTHFLGDSRGKQRDPDYVDRHRFPILQDIFSGKLGDVHNAANIKAWAREQLNAWLTCREEGADYDQLPPWLRDARDFDAIGLFRGSPRGKDGIEADSCLRAVQLYGWGVLTRAQSHHIEPDDRMHLALESVVEIVRYSGEDDVANELLLSYLKRLQQDRKRLAEDKDFDEWNFERWEHYEIYNELSEDSKQTLESLASSLEKDAELRRTILSELEHVDEREERMRMRREVSDAERAERLQRNKREQELARAAKDVKLQKVSAELVELTARFRGGQP